MIDINLLPPEYGPKKVVSLSNLAMIAIFFLICVSLLMSSLRLVAAVQDYSSRVDAHDRQIEHYRREAEKVHELGRKVKLLKARLSLVKELLQEDTAWSDKLVELYQCLPRNDAWINGLDIERERTLARQNLPGKPGDKQAEPIVVHISGGVLSVDKVRQFVANLEDSETFTNVVLDSVTSSSIGVTSPVRSGSDSSISFSIKLQIREGLEE